jgi:hypothetical protein
VAALANLDTARGLAEDRETIENEMTYLSHELISSISPSKSESNPTLLEDIETMHRILKELESVRAYVAVIERTLTLRCAPSINFTCPRWLQTIPFQ